MFAQKRAHVLIENICKHFLDCLMTLCHRQSTEILMPIELLDETLSTFSLDASLKTLLNMIEMDSQHNETRETKHCMATIMERIDCFHHFQCIHIDRSGVCVCV